MRARPVVEFGAFRLDGGGDTLVFSIGAAGAPRLTYWGPSLKSGADLAGFERLTRLSVPPGGLDDGEALSWSPHPGEGFTGHPALIAHREGAAIVFQPVGDFEVGAGAATLELRDPLAGVSLRLEMRLDAETGVLAARSRIGNDAGGRLTVDWLAAAAFPSPHAAVTTFGGRWAREFAEETRTLGAGMIVQDNRTGRTSHHAPPFIVIGEVGAGESQGECFALHLAWSGDHRMLVERLRDGRVQVQAGELLGPGEIVLEEGDSYETPWLYIARSGAGRNGLSDRLHPFVRKTILGGRLNGKLRLVCYNTWEAIYFAHDLDRLKALADLAAEVGVERFVLDDGWFNGRRDDRRALGDWTADPAKYPDGLTPLIDHVRGLGMSFGLWVEPEMANLDSDLLRAHPDWVLGDRERVQPLGRHQYVLDLTRPEVADAIFGQLDALLRDHAIDYLKWDMNRDLTHPVSSGRWAVHRQTRAAYGLIDRLRAAHPAVEIESCASGGGRADYEILQRTDRIWTSDCNDPLERQSIQRAFSLFFPPEVMGAHVGPRQSHTTARTSSMRTRLITAFAGHMGVEADLGALRHGERAELAAAIALHKANRDWMHRGRTVRLEHPDTGCVAYAVIGEGRAFVSAAQVVTARTALLAPLRIVGLDAEALWRVEPILGGTASPFEALGAMLDHGGLPLPRLHAGQCAAFLLTRRQAS
jgi:alpha-galactosidase